MLQHMIRHCSAERETGAWLPTETAQTQSRSSQLIRRKGTRAPAMRALRQPPCPCDEGAKTHTAPRRLRSAPTSRKHCDVCTMDECNADAPIAAEGSMVPSGTPGSFRAAMRQCRPDRQRQHISAAYPRSTLPWQHIDAMRSRGAGRGIIPPRCLFRTLVDGRTLAKCVPPASDSGEISPRCVFGLPAMAIFRRGAFSGGDPRQLFRFMRSRRGFGREKRQFAATYRRHVSKMSWLWQDMRAVHPKSPANGRSGMHRAKVLP